MEWGAIDHGSVLYYLGGAAVGVLTLVVWLALMTAKSYEITRRILIVGTTLILVFSAVAAGLFAMGSYNFGKGRCLTNLPEGRYLYDVAFLDSGPQSGKEDYYLVVRGLDSMGARTPSIQRCVELPSSAYVMLEGERVTVEDLSGKILAGGELRVYTQESSSGGYGWEESSSRKVHDFVSGKIHLVSEVEFARTDEEFFSSGK